MTRSPSGRTKGPTCISWKRSESGRVNPVPGSNYHVEVMGGFTREELAQRAGVPGEFVDRLVGLRIVSTAESEPRFTRGAFRTTRLLWGLEQGGVPLEAVASAVRSGVLSFAFFEVSFWDRFGG